MLFVADIGNTVIVVEHDEDTMYAADHIIDIGPGAGAHGGEVVAAGTPADIMANENFSEKVSVNINTSTLSNIDILVDNGYYSNRSDFINQAVREGLQKHQATLDRIIDNHIIDRTSQSFGRNIYIIFQFLRIDNMKAFH